MKPHNSTTTNQAPQHQTLLPLTDKSNLDMASLNLYYVVAMLALATSALSTNLSPYYYQQVCPQALPAIRRVVKAALKKERRMGASLLRLHFHDCFVNGCDGSVLLDTTSEFESEKDAAANVNSARGFDVVDDIKEEVDRVCGKHVVSCADILTVAARDSVALLGGPTWKVPLGRRDSTTASKDQANLDLPSPFMDLAGLLDNFRNQGLNEKDLVVLSGGHTIGLAQCFTFRARIHNATNIDQQFAKARRASCPVTGGNSNLAPLDPTRAKFDSAYYSNLLCKKGLLASDQALFNGGSTDELVEKYSSDTKAFWADFAKSMVKMGNIKPLTGKQGQIRLNCARVN